MQMIRCSNTIQMWMCMSLTTHLLRLQFALLAGPLRSTESEQERGCSTEATTKAIAASSVWLAWQLSGYQTHGGRRPPSWVYRLPSPCSLRWRHFGWRSGRPLPCLDTFARTSFWTENISRGRAEAEFACLLAYCCVLWCSLLFDAVAWYI